ncbi:non-homologous end-joining DNA ligase [Candidatus Bathyarchaeota archaeon]|nr:non-homologous end-joining DNA ligase [Candidatus Bathyarchaeota archaeon]
MESLMEHLTRARFSNLEKPMYPELGLTKKDIIEYYIKAAPRMLPFLRDRALVRTRYPDGVNGEGFYEKDAPQGTPKWVQTFTKYSRTAGRDTSYVVCNDLDTLLWLANLAAIELHVPLSRTPDTDVPDLVLFDLDPEPPAGLSEAVQAAYILRETLEDLGLKPYVKSSGKKGVHVVIPVEPVYSFDQTKEFAHMVGAKLAGDHDFIVSERSQTSDPGTVLIDYPQNSERSTMVAPYSLRPVREATVSTPLEWGELASLRPYDWNIYNVDERQRQPWKGMLDEPQRLVRV